MSTFFQRMLLLPALFLSLCAAAQTTGYIIRYGGDTIHGTFPGFRQTEYNPKEVRFEQGGKIQTLGLKDIAGFAVDNDAQYRAYDGPRMTNPVTVTAAPSDDRTEHFETVRTFLRHIAQAGKYDFYVFTDEKRANFFFTEGGGAVQELKQWVSLNTGSGTLEESGAFRQQLQDILGANPGNLPFTEIEITRWIRRNSGYQQTMAQTGAKETGWVVLGGISASSFRTSGLLGGSINNYSHHVSPFVSVGYIIRPGRSARRLFLFPQAGYFSYSAHATYAHANNITGIIDVKNVSALTLSLSLGYRLVSQQKLRIFVAPGAQAYFFGNHRINRTYEYAPAYSFAPLPPDNLELQKFCFGLRVMAGVEYRKIWLFVNYLPKFSVSAFSGVEATPSAIQAGAGYRF